MTLYEAFNNKNKQKKIKSEINCQARKMVYDTRVKNELINESDYVRIISQNFKSVLSNNKLKKDIDNTYDYDIYKVMTIARASRYNNQRAIIRKHYEYNKQTKKIVKLKGISKMPSRFFDNDPLLSNAFDNDKIIYMFDLQKIDIEKLM